MSKAKRVMQQNRRAAFIKGITVAQHFEELLKSGRLTQKGFTRIIRWGGRR